MINDSCKLEVAIYGVYNEKITNITADKLG